MVTEPQMQPGQDQTQKATLTFENFELADAALKIILNIQLQIEKKHYPLNAVHHCTVLDSQANIILQNLPPEISDIDLRNMLEEFGKIVSISTRNKTSFVQFFEKESAAKVIQELDGKFIGANKIFISLFKSADERINQCKEVILKSIPKFFSKDEVINYLSTVTGKQIAIDEIVTFMDDTRPPAINSNGKCAIFTCQTKEDAELVVSSVNKSNQQFQNVNEKVQANIKLSKFLKKKNDSQKIITNGIQVFNVNPMTPHDMIEQFFGKYGCIEKILYPKNWDSRECHINILYEKAESRDLALEKYKDDETKSDVIEQMTIGDMNGLQVVKSTIARAQ